MAARVVLTRDHLVQMLLDPAFAAICPAFMRLQPLAAAAYNTHRRGNKRCSACRRNFQAIRPVVDQLFSQLHRAAVDTPDIIDAVWRYLEQRRGHEISTIRIMYRADRKSYQRLSLRFRGRDGRSKDTY